MSMFNNMSGSAYSNIHMFEMNGNDAKSRGASWSIQPILMLESSKVRLRLIWWLRDGTRFAVVYIRRDEDKVISCCWPLLVLTLACTGFWNWRQQSMQAILSRQNYTIESFLPSRRVPSEHKQKWREWDTGVEIKQTFQNISVLPSIKLDHRRVKERAQALEHPRNRTMEVLGEASTVST